MQPDRPRADIEPVEGIDARRLRERRSHRHDKALMPAPAHAETEELQKIGKAEVSSRVVGDMVINGLKGMDQIAYIRYAIVYLRMHDLRSLRSEIDRLLEG